MQSWPEYILEKFLSNGDYQGSFKGKRKAGHSKNRTGKDSKYGGFKQYEGVQNFEEFFKVALEDASPECRHYARQCFLTFFEIWPDEAEPLIAQHKTVLMKHKEIIEKLGPALDGSRTATDYSKRNYIHRDKDRDRKTVKVTPGGSRGFLSPKGLQSRRQDAAPKSQNRVSSMNKFLSEEREERSKPDIPRPTVSTTGVSSAGFRNLKATNYGSKKNENNMYVSKYQNSTRFNTKKRSVSKDVVGTYQSSNLAGLNKNGGGFEPQAKMLNEPDLMELDEKCQDISEIEIDPEDNKEATLYPTPYQGYAMASRQSPRQEISDLLIKAESTNWIDRINAFERIATYLSNRPESISDVQMF